MLFWFMSTKVPTLRCCKRRNFIQVNSLQPRSLGLLWKLKVAPPRQRGGCFYKGPTLVPDWSIFMQMRIPNHTACMVLISWLPALWLVVMEPLWFVSTDANEHIAAQFQLDWVGLLPLVEIQYQELSYKRQLRRQEHSLGGWKLSLAFP